MNRSHSITLALSRAITGFLNFKTAEGLSNSSVASYKNILQHWVEYTGDVHIEQLTSQDIDGYLVYLRNDYVPRRFGGDTRKLSGKTLRNVWITLSSFFRWAQREFHIENPMKDVPVPRFQKVQIEPFTQDEVSRMLKACLYSREAETADRRRFVMRRPTGNRDQAIVLTLVDAGLRASELCSLEIRDFDPKHGRLEIRHGVEGGAKGGKGRTVYLGKTARHAIWRYLANREAAFVV